MSDTATRYCGFCGKAEGNVFYLISGPTVFICDECVELCADIIAEHRRAAAVKAPDTGASR